MAQSGTTKDTVVNQQKNSPKASCLVVLILILKQFNTNYRLHLILPGKLDVQQLSYFFEAIIFVTVKKCH